MPPTSAPAAVGAIYWCAMDPPLGQAWGKIVKWSMKTWSRKPCRGGFPMVAQFRMDMFNIDGMTTVTSQTKYDPTLPFGYPEVAYPLEMSSGSGIYSDAVSHLPATQH